MAERIVPIRSEPGVKRDGTRFEGDFYVDGQWVRFQRGLPRKIGGYRAISKYLREVGRALHEYTPRHDQPVTAPYGGGYGRRDFQDA